MKILSLILLASLSFGALAADEKKPKKTLSEELSERKYHYSALNEFFRETFPKEITKDHLSKLEELLYFTGIELLEDYEPVVLQRYPTSSTRFILGRQSLQEKNFKKAEEHFTHIHPDHRFYPESRLLLAQVFAKQNDTKRQFEAMDQCTTSAEKLETSSPEKKIKRYFRMVHEICLVNKARHFYKTGEFQAALDAYGKIPKESYKWPYILLEKAWVYYQLGDFNRSLGLLVTYKSPLLDTYFFPEAEYLASLAYFRLCLYQDSSIIIDQYYNFYRPRFTALDNVLRQHKNSQTYFYELMFKPGAELKGHEDFVKHIVTRMKKQTRFSLDFNSIYKINQEIKSIELNQKAKMKEKLLPHLKSVRDNLIAKINYNAKSDIFDFLQSVPFYSSELFKVNLEIISKKRDLLYGNKKLISDRSRGDLSNVKRSKFEQFWTFQGAFWADELGDYSLGLKSNCEAVKREGEE